MLDYGLNYKKKKHTSWKCGMYINTCSELNKTMFWDYLVLAQYIDQHTGLTIFTDHWTVQWKTERNGKLFTWNHNTEDAITYIFYYIKISTLYNPNNSAKKQKQKKSFKHIWESKLLAQKKKRQRKWKESTHW